MALEHSLANEWDGSQAVPLAGGRAEPVFAPVPGVSAPYLGIAVAADDSVLLFGLLDDQGGDVLMLESSAPRF